MQNELMLFDPVTSKFYVLNSTMAFVWRRCDGNQSPPQIATALEEEFSGVSAAAAESDVQAAIDELQSLGLITLRENVSA